MTNSSTQSLPWRHLHFSAIFLRAETIAVVVLILIATPAIIIVGPENIVTKYEAQSEFVFRAIAIAVVLIVFGAVRRAFLVYAFLEDSVVVRKGMIRRHTRIIPFERLHNIDTVQSILQRLCDTATVELHTSGTGSEEAKLVGVQLSHVSELRQLLEDYRNPRNDHSFVAQESELDQVIEEEEKEDAHVLTTMSFSDCMKLFLVRNPSLPFIAIVASFAVSNMGFLGSWIEAWLLPQSFSDFFIVRFTATPIPWMDLSINPRADWVALTNWLVVVVLPIFSAFLLISMVISLTIYKNFSLAIQEDMLDARTGSMIRTRKRTPLSRIQWVQVESNVRSRLLRRESIRFITSAGASDTNVFSPLTNWLSPLLKPHETLPIVDQVLPLKDLPSAIWESIDAKRAWPRMLKKYVLVLIPISIMLASFSAWLLVSLLPLTIWLVYACKRSAHSIRFTLLNDVISYQSGWVKKTWTFRAYSKLQSIEIVQNPFDRRHGTATLILNSANNAAKSKIRYVDAKRAKELAKILFDRSAASDFEW